MDIDKSDLLNSAAKLGISNQTAEELWNTLSQRSPQNFSKFTLSHLLYYLGAMIVIIAMGWFAWMAWEHFEGKGVLAVASAYIFLFIAIGTVLWHKKGLKVPGGLFITMAVCLIPLAVYGFQKWTGWWLTDNPGAYRNLFEWVRGRWFFMEAATIIGGCIALLYFRFPFLTAPIFFALWFMSMDVPPLIFGSSGSSDELLHHQAIISMVFGALILVAAYVTDLTIREDFAFWGYLFGVMAFWCGLSMHYGFSRFDHLSYLLVNVVLVILSVFLQRTVFVIFGALGILLNVSIIYEKYFLDSMWFPVVLSLTGILVVFAGILFHKNRQKIEAFILDLFPGSLQQWLPRSRK